MIEVDKGKKYRKLFVEDKFKFSCHKGLACFGQCCSDVNIFLTPYDVLRMRKALGLASRKFLKEYTVTVLAEQRLPLVLLKMRNDKHKRCPFVKREGCTVYHDRPWSCRMYPVGIDPDKKDEANDGAEYCLMFEEGSPCLGFKEGKEWTVKEWLPDQGIDLYNKKGESFAAINLHRLFSGGKNLGPSEAQMFYIACYDLDQFRKFLFGSSFFNRFDIDKEVIEKIKVDDEALLDFGFDWLRFSLFGENTFRIKGKIEEKKKTESGLDSAGLGERHE
jgi:Fe-S-cluster containining protein